MVRDYGWTLIAITSWRSAESSLRRIVDPFDLNVRETTVIIELPECAHEDPPRQPLITANFSPKEWLLGRSRPRFMKSRIIPAVLIKNGTNVIDVATERCFGEKPFSDSRI